MPNDLSTRTTVRKNLPHPNRTTESDPLFVVDIDPPCGHLLHIETDTSSNIPTRGDGYDCETCGLEITVTEVTTFTRYE